MKISLKTNTGQGITIDGSVDVADLPSSVAQKVYRFIKPSVLKKLAKTPKNPDLVDMQQYDLTLISNDPGTETNRFQFSDENCSEEMIELLDELVHEIIINKMKSKK